MASTPIIPVHRPPFVVTIDPYKEKECLKLIFELLNKDYLLFNVHESHTITCPVVQVWNTTKIRQGWGLVIFPNYSYGDLCETIMNSAILMDVEDMTEDWFELNGPHAIGFCPVCYKSSFD